VEIRETFKSAAPSEVLKALSVYCSSFYGSCLWDLGGDKAKQLYTAWNTSVKLVWGLPQQTRTYFLQQLISCRFSSAKVDILIHFVKFFHVQCSASYQVQVISRLLSRDMLSVTGKNLRLVQEMTQLNPFTASRARLRAALEVGELVDIPPLYQWRLPYLSSLLSQRGEAFYSAIEEEEQRLSELIDSLVIN
jgi:hypothetical protein